MDEYGEKKISTANLQIKASEWFSFKGMHHIMAYHEKAITRIKFGHDDRGLFAMSSDDGTISVVDLLCQDIDSSRIILKGHKSEITDFCFSIENDYIVSCSIDKSLIIWDTKTGQMIRGFEDPYSITCVLFHPINDHLLIYGNSNGEVKFISFSNGTQIGYYLVSNSVTSISFDSEKCVSMFVGDSFGELTFLQVKYDSNQYKLSPTAVAKLNRSPINSIYWRNHQTSTWNLPTLLITQIDQNVQILAIRKNDQKEFVQTLCKFPHPIKKSNIRSNYCPVVGRGNIPCVVFGSETGTIYIYGYTESDEKKNSKIVLVNQFDAHRDAVLDCVWNDDESLMGSCDKQGVVIIWKRINLN